MTKSFRALALGSILTAVIACESAKEYAEEAGEYAKEAEAQLSSWLREKKKLRLESNKPGTAFCLAGKPLVAGDAGVAIQSGDRVYVVDPAPETETTVVAAQSDYFAFVDSATGDKVRLQFDFFNRNRCTGSSAGRTCVTSELTSDLKAFESFCAGFP